MKTKTLRHITYFLVVCIMVNAYADSVPIEIPGRTKYTDAPWIRISGAEGVRMRVESLGTVTVKPIGSHNEEIVTEQLSKADPLADSYVAARRMPSGEVIILYRYNTLGPAGAGFIEGDVGESIDLKFLTPNNTLPVECNFHAVLRLDYVNLHSMTNLTTVVKHISEDQQTQR